MVASSLSPNTRFADRFALLERLHTGASTEVWLAEDQRAANPVALKVLSRASAEREAARERFEREWQIARALNHPHTVRALARVEGERPAYAMQYIDGTDFADLVGRPFEVWAPPLLVILDTLVYWHRKGVVHGDLKPANLLLDRGGVAYLADFGCAATIGEENEGVRQRGGSAAYVSPEQRANEAPDPADDVHAIVQVIAELAAGDPGDTALTTLPPAIARCVRDGRLSRDSRPTLASIAEAFTTSGVTRASVNLQALDIALRRPASSVAGALQAPEVALPHGAFERDVPIADDSGVSLRTLVIGLVAIIIFGVLFTQLLLWFGRDEAPTPGPTQPVVTPTEPGPDEPAQTLETSPSATQPPAAEADPASRAAARAEADALVGRLLSILDVLEKRGVALWGGVEYESGKTLYGEGDRAYLAGDYAEATARYTIALQRIEPLTERVKVEFETAMRAADAAMREEDSVAARNAFERALAITPGDPLATLGLARANNLDQVLALMSQGRAAERSADLDAAFASYDAALALDSLWEPAEVARTRIAAELGARQFRNLMSGGLRALDEGRFADARRAFNEAGGLRPSDRSPRDALLQVQMAERLERINGLLGNAEAAEAGERWQQALDDYQQMLSIDANLDLAQAGVVRVKERIALLRNTDRVLANPDRLSETPALRDASALLTRLAGLNPRGPELEGRITRLQDLLKAAAVPIPVTIRSDGATSVSLLRVSQLGEFDATQVRLRPGLYTLVGSRRGYVDARLEFRVKPGEVPAPVYIACEQEI